MKKFVVIEEGNTRTAPIRLNDFISLMKHQFRSADALVEAYPDVLKDSVADIVHEFWNDIIPYDIQKMFAIPGMQTKRFFWASMGANTIFNALEGKTLLAKDSYTAYHPEKGEYKDEVELWRINDERIPTQQKEIAAVRVVCPSTGSVYPLYISQQCEGYRNQDPIGALSSLIWSPYRVEKLEAIKRQGEVYFFKVPIGTKKENSLLNVPKQDFLRLIKEQS